MAYKRIAPEIKEEILFKIKQGTSVAEIVKQYGVNSKSVYGWLSAGSVSSPSALTVGRLKREKDDLLKLVGELTFLLKKGEKSNLTYPLRNIFVFTKNKRLGVSV